MITPRQTLRLARINFVLARHGLDEIVLAAHIFRPIRFLIYFSPFTGCGAAMHRAVSAYASRWRISARSS